MPVRILTLYLWPGNVTSECLDHNREEIEILCIHWPRELSPALSFSLPEGGGGERGHAQLPFLGSLFRNECREAINATAYCTAIPAVWIHRSGSWGIMDLNQPGVIL